MNQEGTSVVSRAAALPMVEDVREEERAGSGPFYCWPVWRFGRVLAPAGQALKVETAQEIGALFERGGRSLQRYFDERLPALARFAGRAGGRLLREFPDRLPGESEPIQHLREHWAPGRVLVTYSFVPIVRLPSFVVVLGNAVWLLRESLTICGHPAKSKIWVTASLIAVDGRPTDLFPLSAGEIDEHRAALDLFQQEALASLKAYYVDVLAEDSRTLALAEPVRIGELAVEAETEILGVSSEVDVSATFEDLEAEGLRELRRRIGEKTVAGAELMGDFLAWTDRLQTREGEPRWDRGKPMILAIYADQPSCGSVRALVTTRTTRPESADQKVWYVALTEVKKKPAEVFPLSEAAARSLAKEYGRYF